MGKLGDIQKALEKKEVTLRELAAATGDSVSYSTISFWTRGISDPRSAKLNAVWNALQAIRAERRGEVASEGTHKGRPYSNGPRGSSVEGQVPQGKRLDDVSFIRLAVEIGEILPGEFLSQDMVSNEEFMSALFASDDPNSLVLPVGVIRGMLNEFFRGNSHREYVFAKALLEERFTQEALVGWISDDVVRGVIHECRANAAMVQGHPSGSAPLRDEEGRKENAALESGVPILPFLREAVELDSIYDVVRLAHYIGLVRTEDLFSPALANAEVERALAVSLDDAQELKLWRGRTLTPHNRQRQILFIRLCQVLSENKSKKQFLTMLVNAGASERLVNALKSGRVIAPNGEMSPAAKAIMEMEPPKRPNPEQVRKGRGLAMVEKAKKVKNHECTPMNTNW